MYIIIGILAGIIILQSIIMWKYQRQVKDICRQLAFLMKHDSNMLIHREFGLGGIGMLSDRLNDLLEIPVQRCQWCPDIMRKIRISISNQVIASEQIDIEHVFDRFYKADAARSKTSTGLGLSIAREFVRRMNGEIGAKIEENEFIVEMRFNL